jgi:DNA-3-methyladenine glycosylase II
MTGADSMLPLSPLTLVTAAQCLAQRDPVLGRVLERHGPPPLWKRAANFATLSRIVIEQQVSLAVAKRTYERLRTACGGTVTAASIAKLDDKTLRAVGLSRQKARYIRELSIAVGKRQFSIPGLSRCDDAEAAQRIRSLLGFGSWSADIYLMMALLRPDVLPLGDLGLVKGIAEVCEQGFDSPEQIIQRAEAWRPWRSVATRMIWHVYLVNRGKDAHAIASG